MSIDNSLFRHELSGNARGFSRDHKIEVRFQGNGAKTSGELIVLPQLDDTKAISDEDQRIMRGYVDHEAAHIRHTEMPLMGEANKQNPLLGHLLNCLEDVRIDKLTIDEFAGAAKNLRATAAGAVRNHILPALKQDPAIAQSPERSAGALITLVGRKHIGLGSAEIDDALAVFPPEFQAWALSFAKRAIASANTREVFALAQEALAEITTVPPPQQQPEPEPDQSKQQRKTEPNTKKSETGTQAAQPGDDAPDEAGDGNGEGDKQDEGSGSSGDQSDKTDEGEDGDEDGDDSEEGDEDEGDGGEDGEDEGDGAAGAEASSESRSWRPAQMSAGNGAGSSPGVLDAEMDKALEDIVRKNAPPHGTLNNKPIRAIVPEAKAWFRLDDPASAQTQGQYAIDISQKFRAYAAKHGVGSYENVRLNKLNNVIGVMTREFERLMASSLNRDKLRNLEAGRLDPRRLTAAYLGKTDVFWQRGERKEVDTAVEVLVDASSSMTGHAASMAQMATIAIGEALERVGVNFAIRAFTSGELTQPHDALCEARARAARERYGSWHVFYHGVGNVMLMDLKDYGQRMVRARPIIGTMGAMAIGGTPLGDAMIEVWPVLAKRPERRKVMLVVTDGRPDAGHVVEKAVKDMEARGVECIGIGIKDGSVSNYFKRHAVVNDATDLTQAMLVQLRKALLPGVRREAA